MIVSNQEFLAILGDCSISLSAKAALYLLRNHQNAQTGQCNPKLKTIAAEMCVSLPTAKRAIAELKKAGMIDRKTTGRSSEYQILTKLFVLKYQIDTSEVSNLTHRQKAPPYSSESIFRKGRAAANAAGCPPRKKPTQTLAQRQAELYFALARAEEAAARKGA